MEEYKIEYNKLLTRYYNGCNYISEHKNETDFYLDELFKIRSKLCKITAEHPEMTTDEILNGFKEG